MSTIKIRDAYTATEKTARCGVSVDRLAAPPVRFRVALAFVGATPVRFGKMLAVVAYRRVGLNFLRRFCILTSRLRERNLGPRNDNTHLVRQKIPAFRHADELARPGAAALQRPKANSLEGKERNLWSRSGIDWRETTVTLSQSTPLRSSAAGSLGNVNPSAL